LGKITPYYCQRCQSLPLIETVVVFVAIFFLLFPTEAGIASLTLTFVNIIRIKELTFFLPSLASVF
jgi:hypothetical protein